MKLNHVVAGTLLAAGLSAGSLVGAGAAGAVPVGPGSTVAEKPPYKHDWLREGDGPGRGHGKWRGGDVRGIDACISAASPYGTVSGYVCI